MNAHPQSPWSPSLASVLLRGARDELYESDSDFIDDAEWPSCADLPDTDTGDENLVPQHEEWGCAPLTSL